MTPWGMRVPPGMQTVLDDIAAERARQVVTYGDNADLEDGTGPETRWLLPYTGASATEIEATLRYDYGEYEEEAGKPTWTHLIREEVAEAFAERNQIRLREELVQVAALCVSWCEKIDARTTKPDTTRYGTIGHPGGPR